MPNRSEDPVVDIGSRLILSTQLDELNMDIDHLRDISLHGDFDAIIANGKSAEQKEAALQKMIEQLHSPLLVHALVTQLKAKKWSFFGKSEFSDFIANLAANNDATAIVRIVVAISFAPSDLEQMVAVLREQLGKAVALDVEVDKSLIGGCTVQYGSHIWDSSIKSRLQTFRDNWQEAVTKEK